MKAKRKDLRKVKWRKISAPTRWTPQIGEDLIGYYIGRTKRDGSFGQYECVVITVPYRGTYMVTGTHLVQLVDAALLISGDAVRVVFAGHKPFTAANGDIHTMKLFELYVGDEEERATDIPEVFT